MKLTLDIPNRFLAMVAGGGLCFAAGTVIATEFPSDSEAMYYSGLLTDSAGNPRTDAPELQVELFGSATGGSALCGSMPVTVDLAASQGRFRVALPAACTDVVRDYGDTWARVTVGSTLLPRQKLGATAYATVARDALSADTVIDGGVARQAIANGAIDSSKLDSALQDQLGDLDAALSIADGFASRTGQSAASWFTTYTASSNVATDFPVGTIRYDEQSEVSVASKGFVVQRHGLYLITGSWESSGIADQCPVLVYVTKNDGRVSGLIQLRQSTTTGPDIIGASVAHVERLMPGDVVRFRSGISPCAPTMYGFFQVTRLN
jgi:hypothetical protein